MKHGMNETFYYCKWCGESLQELVENNQERCHGQSGIYHIDYLKAKKKCDTIFQPIIDKIIL